MLKKFMVEGINAIIFILSTLMLITDFLGIAIPDLGKIIIIVLLIIIYVVLIIIKILKEKFMSLMEGSGKFFNYFDEWYSKKGKLSIFCTDLDWMQKPPYDLITTLEHRTDTTVVYLRNKSIDPDLNARLKKHNISVCFVDDNVLTQQRFSIRENDGTTYMIIGEKDTANPQIIVFKRENDKNNPYMINIAKDFLRRFDETCSQ